MACLVEDDMVSEFRKVVELINRRHLNGPVILAVDQQTGNAQLNCKFADIQVYKIFQ